MYGLCLKKYSTTLFLVEGTVGMEVHQVLHMNAGEGEYSYAFNSSLQKSVIIKVKPVIEDAILDLCRSNTSFECLRIADLGSSSGPNSLLVISEILDITITACHLLNRPSPGFQVFLNDLPGNDFNTIFKSLPAFYQKLEIEKRDKWGRHCFIAAMPGSFYGRLFPNQSLHFVHSSYSLHFLSQVPQGLESEDVTPLNKRNIYLGRTSPLSVVKAYQEQFQKDFSLFLKSRCEEIVSGGRVVLTLMSRRSDDPRSDENCTPWNLITQALNDMVSEGLVEEAKVDNFNVPYYATSTRELKSIIKAEGSFNLHRLEIFEVSWDGKTSNVVDGEDVQCVSDNLGRAKNVANILRAATEPLLVCHLGVEVIDELFHRFTSKLAKLFTIEEPKCVNLVVSMSRK